MDHSTLQIFSDNIRSGIKSLKGQATEEVFFCTYPYQTVLTTLICVYLCLYTEMEKQQKKQNKRKKKAERAKTKWV